MRASVVLLLAFLALAFAVAYAADEVSVYDNIAGCFYHGSGVVNNCIYTCI